MSACSENGTCGACLLPQPPLSSLWPTAIMHRRQERSASRERSRSRSHSDRSRSLTPEIALPHGAEPISESDYFLRSDEFRAWLKDEKRKVRSTLDYG